MEAADTSTEDPTRNRPVRALVIACVVLATVLAGLALLATRSTEERFCTLALPIDPPAFPTPEEALAAYVARTPGAPPTEQWQRHGDRFTTDAYDQATPSPSGHRYNSLGLTKDYQPAPDANVSDGWSVTEFCTTTRD